MNKINSKGMQDAYFELWLPNHALKARETCCDRKSLFMLNAIAAHVEGFLGFSHIAHSGFVQSCW